MEKSMAAMDSPVSLEDNALFTSLIGPPVVKIWDGQYLAALKAAALCVSTNERSPPTKKQGKHAPASGDYDPTERADNNE